ncbi:MAG: hypothetical protein IAG10_34510 [Planctomycetaceae bacterium]|nr:hypothetical protein [Planctomycetaceae bacterium]
MNLSVPKPAAVPKSQGPISTYTILLLSGVLFGMCVSGDLPPEVKHWFVFAGTTGLVAYLGLRVVANVHQQTQQRVATMQAEERLDRHAHCDLRIDRTSAAG